jgi:hypothetical protein
MQRSAHVCGDWALTITYCEWSVLLEGAPLAHCESSDTTIARALGVLNGQALSSVKVDPATAATTFTFDLGCVLATHAAPAGSYDDDGPEEQWILAQPNGMYLAVRADGAYSQQKGDSQDDPQWHPLPA